LAAAMNPFANTPDLRRFLSSSLLPPMQPVARAPGCVKMCKRGSVTRWGASTCAKPRIKPPAENPGAGPRFPRSDRAERASL
jgi:hypothetical protein